MIEQVHNCIVGQDGLLTEQAKAVPELRDGMRQLAQTKALFRPSDIVDTKLDEQHLWLCKAWRPAQPFREGNTRSRVYVNPDYVHYQKYPAVYAECQCGAMLDRCYNDGFNGLDDPHRHDEECLPHWRLEARATINRQRYERIKTLSTFGWRGPDLAHSFGMEKRHIGKLLERYHINIRDEYNGYRRRAGNTYHVLLNNGVAADRIADIYRHDKSTLGRWRRKYGDYAKDESVASAD